MTDKRNIYEYDAFQVGETIRQLRMKKGMSIGELSDEVNKSESHIKQVELGSRSISLDLLFALMKVFETDANTILAIGKEQTVVDSIERLLQTLPDREEEYFTRIIRAVIKNYPLIA